MQDKSEKEPFFVNRIDGLRDNTIFLKARNEALGLFNFLREFLQKAVLQLVLLALMAGLHQF